MGIEDSAVLAELLEATQQRVLSETSGHPTVTRARTIEAAFGAFDKSRRARTQWLVQSSRFCSMVCQGRGAAKDWDVEKRRQELDARARIIWNFEAPDAAREALADLVERLSKEEENTGNS